MVQPACSEEEFVELFETLGPLKLSQRLAICIRSVYERRRGVEKRLGRRLVPRGPNRGAEVPVAEADYPYQVNLTIKNGTVIVGSDFHYWPEIVTTAHRALVALCKKFKPYAVILNGDVLDGATVSRFAPIGWEKRPSLIQEIEAAQERLREIELAAPKAKRIWTLGNHDSRFETRLATVAPEYARIHGMHLKDHFPLWDPAWLVIINDEVVVKHRFRGGIHATHNNVLWSGKTIITGHLHSQKSTPLTDYSGTRWGVDTGCVAEPKGPQFVDYTEANPKNWRSGFGVFDFKDGEMLQPQLVRVIGPGKVDFCREIISV